MLFSAMAFAQDTCVIKIKQAVSGLHSSFDILACGDSIHAEGMKGARIALDVIKKKKKEGYKEKSATQRKEDEFIITEYLMIKP